MVNDLIESAMHGGMETIEVELFGIMYQIPKWSKHVAVDIDGWVTVFEEIPVWIGDRFVRDGVTNGRSMVLTRTQILGKTLLKSVV